VKFDGKLIITDISIGKAYLIWDGNRIFFHCDVKPCVPVEVY
jgi:hypothetical protein